MVKAIKVAAAALGSAAGTAALLNSVRNVSGTSPLSIAITALLAPLVNLIEKRNSFGDQSGHEVGVLRDEPLRILFDSVCRDLHRQAYGIYNPQTNSINSNSKQRLDDAEIRAANLFRKYESNPEEISADPTFDFVSSQVAEADERHKAYTSMLDGFKSVYKDLFRKEWVYEAYVPRTTNKVESASAVERMKQVSAKAQPSA